VTYPAFSGFGIELEYMIVNENTLNVLPIADRLLDAVGGAEDMDVDRGDAAWSNELALHVIEIKTAGPARDLAAAARTFRNQISEISALLQADGACLLPTGMHPWMDPLRETKLWPHQNNEIYQAFDRIFDCRGHGWSNLQSCHINFPFETEEEFGRLHAAIRLVLPLLPALAASSPYKEGVRGEDLDTRLATYRTNCARVPLVTGNVIPEQVFNYRAYQELLERLYASIAPLDPEGILQEEWLNARGAIARFDRQAIEIRVLDTQECPEQDLAIAYFATELVKALYREEWISYQEQQAWTEFELAEVFSAAVRSGASADIPGTYARALGCNALCFRDVSSELLRRLVLSNSPHRARLDLISDEGSLAERIVRRVERKQSGGLTQAGERERLFVVYSNLAECLASGTPYVP
jgi:gamma-glutamyl:cysteine ligase YbdK (ATP-grasp superfamily)